MNTMGKILVVDDNESILQLITDFFSNLKGHTVYSANNAKRAMELVHQHNPELALLDIMMPEVHGVELLRQIKKVSPDMKAIMITAVDDEDIAEEAMREGAVDYVTKPLDLNYLDTVVTFQLMG
jgi:two-component system response regulator (stage 0 sporulation protein F)